MTYKYKSFRYIYIAVFLLIWLASSSANASSPSPATLYNLQAYPGNDATGTIKLIGDVTANGFWYVRCDDDAKNNPQLNIASWITIPNNYTITPGQTRQFTIKVSVPANAQPGLYGVTSTSAAIEGHWYERKTWVGYCEIDTNAQGQQTVAMCFEIPVSVRVLGISTLTPTITITPSTYAATYVTAISTQITTAVTSIGVQAITQTQFHMQTPYPTPTHVQVTSTTHTYVVAQISQTQSGTQNGNDDNIQSALTVKLPQWLIVLTIMLIISMVLASVTIAMLKRRQDHRRAKRREARDAKIQP